MQHFFVCLTLSLLCLSCGTSSNEDTFPKDNKPLFAGLFGGSNVLFNGQYVEGVILAKAVNDDFGLVEMHKSHDYSYMALYRGEDLDMESLHESVYFKVKEIQGVPIAFDIKKKSAGSISSLYPHDPITRLRFHSFDDNDLYDFFHIRKHLSIDNIYALSSPESLATHAFDFGLAGGGSFRLYGDEDVREAAVRFGSGEFWVQFGADSVITAIDTCHQHGEFTFECRN